MNAEGYVFTTFAGSIARTTLDEVGADARFEKPEHVAMDSRGNIFVTDSRAHVIRKIAPDMRVTTFAGLAGESGYADGIGAGARFMAPWGIVVDRADNLIISDQGGVIRVITPSGRVRTLAGQGDQFGRADGVGTAARFNEPSGIALGPDGNIYVADKFNHTIRKVTPDGTVTTLAGSPGVSGYVDAVGTAARFNIPLDVAVDGAGNVWTVEYLNAKLRRIAPDGTVTSLGGAAGYSLSSPRCLTIEPAGTIVVSAGSSIQRVTMSGGVTTLALAQFNGPEGIFSDGSGGLLVADSTACTVRKVSSSGVVSTLAGMSPLVGSHADGVGRSARFDSPGEMTIDAAGNLYVADVLNFAIRKVTPGGRVSTFAGTPRTRGYVNGPAGTNRFDYVLGLALDASGNLVVADYGNYVIRKVSPSGEVSLIAGQPGSPILFADGQGAAARFQRPAGMSVDASDNIYVADSSNNQVRKITPDAVVSTVTAANGASLNLSSPSDVVLDPAGNLYIADAGHDLLKKLTPEGVLSNFDYIFNSPGKLWVDAGTSIYFTEYGSETKMTVRRRAITGTGSATFGGPVGSSNGSEQVVRFDFPDSAVVDASGNLYVADSSNNVIRKGRRVEVPEIVTPPRDQIVAAGSSARLSVDASGTAPLRYQWRRNGVVLSDGLNSWYATPLMSATYAGLYTVTVSNALGSVTSDPVLVGLDAPAAAPAITTQPSDVEATAGTAVVLTVAASASGGGAVDYQWQVDGVSIPGANRAQLVLPSVQEFHAGSYTCLVSSGGIFTVSAPADLAVREAPASAARLMNLSTRALALSGDGVLIPGFVINGSGTKRLLIRGVGPALARFGVGGILVDPVIRLESAGVTLATNDNWSTNTNAAEIAATAAEVGAFAFEPGSNDAALLLDLAAGVYTVPTGGAGGGTGIGMVEVYDADRGAPNATLVNISNRGFVGSGENLMIPGLVVSEEGPRTFLLRAVGPTLAGFGVAGTLNDPVLTIFRGTNAILTNDDWEAAPGAAMTASVARAMGAFPLNGGSRDAALVVTLPPGPYTVQATGKSEGGVGATGIALVEVYLVP